MQTFIALGLALLAHEDPRENEPPPDAPPEAEVAPLVVEPAAEDAAQETTVRAVKPRTSSSSTTVRDRDLELRPKPRPADILSSVPGFFVIQHAGGGKANQYFLRGFDADHGTDVLLSVDGVPVNMPSHGHGQGYTDLNWVIPELVKRIDVKKGPYFADTGDFATAGAIDMVTVPHIDSSSVSVSTGAFLTDRALAGQQSPLLYSRALTLVAPEVSGAHPFFAGEVVANNGAFETPERLERFSLFARAPLDLGDSGRVTVTATSYGAGWNAANQIPARAVKDGRLTRFAVVDPSDGGNSQRHSLVARFDRGDSDESLMVSGYLLHYRLAMFSNFTFFLVDQERGDQIEQDDARNVMGLHARYASSHAWGPIVFDTRVGAQMRNDLIENALYATRERARHDVLVDAEIQQGSLGVYAEEEVALPPWLRLVLGARADGFGFQVDDALEPLDGSQAATSGTRFASVVSPKASLVVTWPEVVELYGNAGMGFHSNDARGVVRASTPNAPTADPLTRAFGYEVGARTRLLDRIDLAASAFGIDLERETVWVGDAGTTEESGATRRLGVEVEGRANVLVPWLFLDADATATRGVYLDARGAETGEVVALAPTLLLSAGVSVYDLAGFFGRLGIVHLGDRPASEDGFFIAEGFTRLDGALGWRSEAFEVALDVQNLTNTRWREAQFVTTSRLPGEDRCPSGTRTVADEVSDTTGCEDVSFTAGAPLNARLTATLRF